MTNCEIVNELVNGTTTISIGEYFTAIVGITTLLVNVLFYIVIAPRIGFRFQKKEDFLKYSSEFMTYLAQVNSLSDFDGAPTKVKNYCESIQLLFKEGVAPAKLQACMEEVFQLVKERKDAQMEKTEMEEWELCFRKKTHDLRKYLAKYTGVFRS